MYDIIGTFTLHIALENENSARIFRKSQIFGIRECPCLNLRCLWSRQILAREFPAKNRLRRECLYLARRYNAQQSPLLIGGTMIRRDDNFEMGSRFMEQYSGNRHE